MDELESHSPLSVPRDLKFLAVRNLYVFQVVKSTVSEGVDGANSPGFKTSYVVVSDCKYLFLKEKIGREEETSWSVVLFPTPFSLAPPLDARTPDRGSEGPTPRVFRHC